MRVYDKKVSCWFVVLQGRISQCAACLKVRPSVRPSVCHFKRSKRAQLSFSNLNSPIAVVNRISTVQEVMSDSWYIGWFCRWSNAIADALLVFVFFVYNFSSIVVVNTYTADKLFLSYFTFLQCIVLCAYTLDMPKDLSIYVSRNAGAWLTHWSLLQKWD